MHGLAIDAVIFGFHERQLRVLLMQYKKTGMFALPGGFIHKTENLNDAALRVVSERTGLKNIYLEQFYVFGDYSRFDAKPLKTVMIANGMVPDDESLAAATVYFSRLLCTGRFHKSGTHARPDI